MSYSYTANGNISVSTIVKFDSTSPFRVIQATAASDYLIGVCSESVDKAPIPQDTSTQYAAIAGEDLKVYLNGDHASLTAATGGNTAGDLLTSDGSGNGLTTTTATNSIVGRAEDTVVASALGRCFINTFSFD
jgi:hypothetical protein